MQQFLEKLGDPSFVFVRRVRTSIVRRAAKFKPKIFNTEDTGDHRVTRALVTSELRL